MTKGQFTETICQIHTDALIGPDRNDWAHNVANQTPPVNESYLHNFGPPAAPCGISSPIVTSLVVDIDLQTINTSVACANVPVFGNVLYNCPLTTTSVCPIEDDVLTATCDFGAGATAPGTFSLDIVGCGPAPAYTDAIGVDLVPSTHTVSGTCPVNGMAISTGEVTLTYEICVTWTFDNTCDDNDPCTVNDVYDASCNCAGTYADADGDGVCDTDDICPNGDDTVDTDNDGIPDDCDNCNTGDACTDNDPCTVNDAFDANCNCVGTFVDSDGDGVCDADDVCPNGDDNIDTDNDGVPDFCDSCNTGAACDDGDPCTINDSYDAFCDCFGTTQDSDGDGVCDVDDICNGGNDNIDTDNDGIPDFCDPCNTGESCNDNDPCTTNDMYDANCNCSGTYADSDGDGVCDADDICPGGNDNLDTDNDGIPDFCDNCNTGAACDDGDPCTINDVYDAFCDCFGTTQDSDGDGVCDMDDICDGGNDNIDTDNDGIPDFCDPCNTGESCNDNDPCTTNDVYDANCNCAGTYADADGDGVCNADDICPGGNDNLDADNDGIPDFCDNCNTGAACDDNDPCTTNDVYDANCNCVGTFADADGDGVCDADDICAQGDDNVDSDNDGIPDACDNCSTGAACDDNDPCTTNDVYDANCNCAGTFADGDGDGVCDADDICAGGDDNIDSDNDGTPDACDNCSTGAACDDNDPCTTNDVYDANCNCVGTFADSDGDGVCDADDICAGGDDNIDSDNDGIPDACENCTTGAACDDNDPCTTGDVYDANCNCVGTFADSDGDGVCDADDICAQGDDNIDTDNDGIPDAGDTCNTGAACDDNDPCTTNDVYDANCNCAGTFADADGDGVCDADDICAGGDDNIDSDNDGTPDACDNCSTGAVCDDNDPCTTNDVYDASCNCAGTFDDADADGVCDADDICAQGDDNIDTDNDGIPDACDNCNTGATCDDNDPCTMNDVFDANCNCAGVVIDCSNGTTSVVSCDDGDPSTNNDVETILDCDQSICIPCAGEPCNVQSSIGEPTQALSCDVLDFGLVIEIGQSTQGANISYEWIYDDMVIGEQSSIEVFEEGVYELVVYDSDTGCTDTSSYNLVVPEPDLIAELSIDDESCGDDGVITVMSVNGGSSPYLYSLNGIDFTASEQFSNLTPGSYMVTVKDMNGCTADYDVTIENAEIIFFEVGENPTIILGDSVQLEVQTNADLATIEWQGPAGLNCIDCSAPYVNPLQTSTFVVRAVTTDGCEYVDEVTVNVSRAGSPVYIPTAFTPNQDGNNDRLEIFPSPILQNIVQFKIFDRWGSQVYSKENFFPTGLEDYWDGRFGGKDLNSGVYPYFLEVVLKDGSSKTLRGSVTLLR